MDKADQGFVRKVAMGGPDPATDVPTPARRRLIKGGLSVAPVILTLTSRPVLGFENACLSPSRMISGNHSGFVGPESCEGLGLTGYLEQVKSKLSWTDEKFKDLFGTAYLEAGASGNSSPKKVGEVFLSSFDGKDGNPYSTPGFACHIIAAYLNASGDVGKVASVLAPAQVIHMWNDVIGSGQYCPQPGMCWTAIGVVGYLQNSGIVPLPPV
jgi:hypothetical protein